MEKENGQQPNLKATVPPFQLERTLLGVAQGYMEISERVVNGQLGTGEAREATRALNGVPQLVKTQLEAIRIFEKGSQRARDEAAKILGIKPEAPAQLTAGSPTT
jgi:hypothetical protein